jgi:hypothetical protein
MGLPAPTFDVFRADPALDPNPHNLDLPDELLKMYFLVRVLAVWGPNALIEVAVECARFQINKQSTCSRLNRKARDDAMQAVLSHLATPSGQSFAELRMAAAACWNLYKPHEGDPDSPEATATWNELGAPWFAAETILQDSALTEWDGEPPREASCTWGNRLATWPQRAADAAAFWTSPAAVVKAVKARMLSLAASTHDGAA